MKNEAPSVGEQILSSAGEVLDAGLFWRGNLTRAVRRRDFKGTIWGVGGLSLVLFFYVWQHMQVVKLGYEVQGLKVEKQQLENQYYYLQYQMYDVDSLSKIEKTAREQLGMVTPRADQIVILKDRDSFQSHWFSYWTTAMKKVDKP